jgi:hypothetical protein
MKLVRVKNKQGIIISDNNLPSDLDYFLNENTALNTWGKPERWQLASEPHDQADVLETEERDTKEVLGITNPSDDSLPSEPIYKKETWVKLKAEYTIEIEDVTVKLANEKRIAEVKKLLAESDFRMTNDYFLDMSDTDKTFWTNARSLWRNELRNLS